MSTAIRRSLPFLAGLVLLLSGCNSAPKFIFDGTWHGNRSLKLPEVSDDVAYTAGDVQLRIKDGKFELIDKGIPSAGNVVKQDKSVVLETTEVFQRPLIASGPDADKEHPPIRVTPQEDGSVLFDNPLAVDGKPLGLNRVKD